ncbi:hypothetical protein [Clostridium chauvoei]|uniref:Uncharacterized protein n=2 Tax=Clostridium chauvoei TaxID=46867 RepID=S6EU73_9CLOT|nr:hypothetical protein [Clostridium chauvoei]ATD53845.1 hypothetical protein BTM20_00585 [Clostridium chauvoei]ATD58351.1 hypothetical protein BTM21_11735 [Clostridium chauvoei]MBX7280395.1 hypothetical protein [Clostridium chauvoei]MBX7282880.1 hypothetical protein [Clostridium chauvoei]MBX7285286.1 hypothetical protein [Clostridium chauvoei]
MKGKIIDYSNFEAFVCLEDDTIIKLPLSEVDNYTSIGSTVNISSQSGSFGYCNNHSSKIYKDKLVDFF